jgi:hypothetical protein
VSSRSKRIEARLLSRWGDGQSILESRGLSRSGVVSERARKEARGAI